MIFDYKAYSRLLNEFIIEGEKIEQYRDPAFNKILEPICKFLRISRISSAVFDSTCDSAIIKSAPHIYYDDGNADSTRVLKFTENNVRACKANYSFMQSKSGQDWSDEEVQQIEAFEKLIYMFCDRSYASTIAKDLSMFDNDLMIYPLTFFLATVKNLIRQGRIGEFGGVYFNIKHFSSINDRFGRDCATNIMKLFIHGILEKILYEECICRVGGDNFVVLFKKDNLNIIKNYLSGMPITFNDEETVTVTTTAGYYMIPEATESATDVMDRISTAYQLAKSVYKRPFLFYDDEIMQHQTHVKEIEMMFPSAIENEEFKVFIEAMEERPVGYTIFTVMYYTGLRVGELLALTPEDIDFDRHIISVNKNYQRLNGKDYIYPPKTEAGYREVVMPKVLENCLKDYLAKLYEVQPTDRIFPYDRGWVGRQMKYGCDHSGTQKIRVHDVRHTHASLLIDMGCTPLLVAERLGHERVQTTMETYSHLYPNRQTEVAAQLDAIATKDDGYEKTS